VPAHAAAAGDMRSIAGLAIGPEAAADSRGLGAGE
jgi:hypothetical protein